MALKVFTAFSGYDSQCLALDRLGIDYELVGWSEIDKYAIQAHNALYPQWSDRNYGDISKINWDNVSDFDLFTYSSPCQDFSNAGLQKGGEEGSGTRSSLLWECRRAILAKKPKYLLMENVSALVSKKFLPLFNKWQKELEEYGYRNFAKVLNSKDFGTPQNRSRIFLVSILGDENYTFPSPFKLEKRLKDILEEEVDSKYYLSDKLIKSLMRDNKGFKGMSPHLPPYDGHASCLTARMFKMGRGDNYISDTQPKVLQVGNIVDDGNINFKNPQRGRVYSDMGISPCLNTCQGGGLEPKIIKEGNYSPSNHNASSIVNVEGIAPTVMENHGTITAIKEPKNIEPICLNSKVDGKQPSLQDRVYDIDGIATSCTTGFHPNILVPQYRIRKLTPRECFRLMGVSEVDIDKIQVSGISNTQQYKLAGNSIVVDTLCYIFNKMFIDKERDCNQLTLF